MPARRSDDPAAAAQPSGTAAADYWTRERRHAARPVPLRREPPQTGAAEAGSPPGEPSEDELTSADEESDEDADPD